MRSQKLSQLRVEAKRLEKSDNPDKVAKADQAKKPQLVEQLPDREAVELVQTETSRTKKGTGRGVDNAKLRKKQAEVDAGPKTLELPLIFLEYGLERSQTAPKTKALVFADVANAADAARAIGKAIGAPKLGAELTALAETLGKKKPAFERMLGAFAVLSDSAANAPNYQTGLEIYADSRIGFRRVAGDYEYREYEHTDRRAETRKELRSAIAKVLESDDPVGSLEKQLAARFLAEIGLAPNELRRIKAKPEAIIAALEHELLVPLRGLIEVKPSRSFGIGEAEKRALAVEIAKSVVEGTFESWRSELKTSKVQLSVLPAAERKKWLAGMEIKQDVGDKRNKITATTRDVTGLELFWATKVGGPSHGFDSFMSECALALLTNARNGIIMVEDPRWPTGACRAYFRLLRDKKEGKPVLYLEDTQHDFRYRPYDLPTHKLLLRHAVERAKQLGAELVVHYEYMRYAQDLGLKMQEKDKRVVFDPAELLEAGTITGDHHMRQQKPHEITIYRAPVIAVK